MMTMRPGTPAITLPVAGTVLARRMIACVVIDEHVLKGLGVGQMLGAIDDLIQSSGLHIANVELTMWDLFQPKTPVRLFRWHRL